MEIIRELERSERETSTALGYFDGLHKGHEAVIAEAVENAAQNGLVPTVFTLLQSPRVILRGEQPKNIMTLDDKLELLEAMGVERVYLIDFATIKDITAESFVSDILRDCFNARHISCGFNYHFGAGARGSGEMLEDMCRSYGISVLARPRVTMGGEPVSSTRIRKCILEGNITDANEMLGRAYGFAMPVVHGRELGRTLGTPTINQELPEGLVVPRSAAYASSVEIDGTLYCGVTDIGVKPTVGSDRVAAETWMPDYTGGELYGKKLRVRLLEFIRDEKRFPDVEQLRDEILRNGETAKQIFSDYCKEN